MVDPTRNTFSFLHAADLHLDSPLRGLSSYPGAPAERLREATREALVALIDLALEREVAFVILAGDLFDGEWKDFSSGLWFLAELRRLGAGGIPVFVLRGNHDAEGRVVKKLGWPAHVVEFSSSSPQTVCMDDLGVALHGQSYAVAHVEENLALGYPDPVDGLLNIGVLHTGLEGYEGHGHYAPCTLDDLRAKGYDYWALGHIHKRGVVSEDPWVVFPGNLQGRHIRETGPKGATVVHVEGGQITHLESVTCDVARWAVVTLDLSDVETEEELLKRVEAALQAESAAASGRLLAARVQLGGSTGLNATLRTEGHRVTQEIRARASGVSGDIWIEKLVCETGPARDARAPDGDDPLADFASRVDEIELGKDVLDELGRDLQKLSAKLPAAVRETMDPANPSELAEALPDALQFLAALLRPGAGAGAGQESEA